MSRKPLIRSNIHPYHITARVNNREKFHCGQQEAWDVFCYHLNEMNQLFDLKTHAFVMMPNHFHLLTTTPTHDLNIVMHRLMISLTKTISSKSGRTGRLFGGRYHWSIVMHPNHFDHVQKYIYRNPVKAQLTSKVEEYSFSSILNITGESKNFLQLFPMSGEKSLIPEDNQEEFLKWLNVPFKNEEYLSIQKGLRKTRFAPTKN